MLKDEFELRQYMTKGDMYSLKKEGFPYLINDIGEENDLAINSLLDVVQGTKDNPSHVVINISHFHLDHYGGLDYFLEECEKRHVIVDSIILPHEPSHVDEQLEEFLDKIIRKSKTKEFQITAKEKEILDKASSVGNKPQTKNEKEEALKKIIAKCKKDEEFERKVIAFYLTKLKTLGEYKRSNKNNELESESLASKRNILYRENLKSILGEEKASFYLENFEKALANEKTKTFKQKAEGKIPFCYAKTNKDNELIIEIFESGKRKEVLAKDYLGFDSCKAYIPTLNLLKKINPVSSLRELCKENNLSVGLSIAVNKNKIALLGDIERAGLKVYEKLGLNLKEHDIIKDPHHSLLSGSLFVEEKIHYWFCKTKETLFLTSASREHNNLVQRVYNLASTCLKDVKNQLITSNGGSIKFEKGEEIILNSGQVKISINSNGEKIVWRDALARAFIDYYYDRSEGISKEAKIRSLKRHPEYKEFSDYECALLEKMYQKYRKENKEPQIYLKNATVKKKSCKSKNIPLSKKSEETPKREISFVEWNDETKNLDKEIRTLKKNLKENKEQQVEIEKTFEQKLKEEKDKIDELQNEVEKNYREDKYYLIH